MHIVFFNRSFYPDTAATGQLLTELCEDLVRQHNCRVSVVAGQPLLPAAARNGTYRARGYVLNRESYRGIDIYRARGTRFPKHRVVGRFSNYVSYFLVACYASLRLRRPDVVVALTDPPIIGLAAYLCARRFGAPLLISYRDVFPEVTWILEDFQSATLNRLLHQVNRFLVRKAERVVALGETMRRRLIDAKGADPLKTVVIPDWADCSAIEPGPKQNPFSTFHRLTDAFVVMHAGNMGLSQGLEVLIQAAIHLDEFPPIQVVFVGAGMKKNALQEQVRDLGLKNVRFLPFQPKEALKHSYATAHVFVLSLKRGLAGYIVPSKLYGILAAGRPYVAAVEEACEITAITNRFNCGLIAEPGNPKVLAEKILTLYHDRDLAQRMSDNARKAALEFDRRCHVRTYHDLLQDLANGALVHS